MYYRCELLVGGYVYDVTDNLVNWDDVELTFKRGDYDGVVRSFSTKFEFANEGYSVLVGEYQKNYLDSAANIVFYKRNNSWLWNEVFRCSLDFSTFSYDGMTCQINAVDDSLAALIKAKKGTQYEYSVNVIKENEPLIYDHLDMQNKIEWIFPEGETEGSAEITMNGGFYTMPMYVKAGDVVQGSTIYEDNTIGEYSTLDDIPTFFENTSGKTLVVRIRATFKIVFNSTNGEQPVSGNLFLEKLPLVGDITQDRVFFYQFLNSSTLYTINIDKEFEMKTGETLRFYFSHQKGSTAVTQTIYDWTQVPTIEYRFRNFDDTIDVVKPITLLNRLLRSMNGGNEGLTGEIADTDERLNNTMLMAADSARGLNGAKLYSSYTKFCNWMSAEFGFVPVVGESSVKFVHRSTLFQDKEVKDLGNDCTEFEYSVNAGMIYSRVRVGYDKVDYESVNGKDEFRFTNEYTTGTTLTDNSLELISPYRADAYGIEFLVNKRGEDTTDNESDNDVFMVGAKLNGSNYELIRDGYTVEGVISPETMFNAMYAQNYMIDANGGYIGVFCDLLEYASSDGNSDASVNGVVLSGDVTVADRLFTVGELSVETGDTEIPIDLTGYLTVTKNGKDYRCYLKDVDFGVGKNKSVKYSLIVKEIV